MKRITEIRFWKRSAHAMNQIDEVTLQKEADSYFLITADSKREVPIETFVSIEKKLIEDSDIFKTKKMYLAHLYEDYPELFEIKFFLCLKYEDNTYFAIKGLFPFKQPHYQDILDLFSDLF